MQSLVPTEESSLLMHAYAIGLLYHERIRSGYIHMHMYRYNYSFVLQHDYELMNEERKLQYSQMNIY